MDFQKIALLRANALGDFIFILPAIRALKETFPTAELVLLGKQWHKDFLKTHPTGVDRVVVIPPISGVGALESIDEDQEQLQSFFQDMKHEHFDLGFQAYGGGKYSNPFMKQLGIKQLVGFQASDALAVDISIPYFYYQNEYLRALELVHAVGARTSRIEPVLFANEEDRKQAYQAVDGFDEPYVLLHPGASDPRRRWPAEKFAEIGDWFQNKEFRVFITGTEAEREITQSVLKQMKTTAVDLTGKLDLNVLTGVISEARMIVSNDTGPFHLAYALRTPAIGIFWCGNGINAGPITRRLARPLLSWDVACPRCHQLVTRHPFDPTIECAHEFSFVASVSTDEVKNQAQQLLTEPLAVESEH